MKIAAAAAARSRGLRVFVRAPDGPRRSRLATLLDRAGHDVVDAVADADVVLADGDCPAGEGPPVIALGGAPADHAGFLAQDATPEQVDAALRAVAAGLLVRGAPRERGFAEMKELALRALLTPREIEILDAIGRGLTNKMIARRLEISLHTVKFHVESVFRKLGVRSRAEAVARALERRRREEIEL